MKFVIVDNKTVEFILFSDSKKRDNWVEIPDGTEVDVGWTDNEDGTFTAPIPVVVPPGPSVIRKLTHLGFRERFTNAEQEWADELEATFESSAVFTTEQKRMLRTGYKNFNLATEVDLDDPRIPPMLGLYVALGGLAPNRPSEILL